MGMITTILLHNDALADIAREPAAFVSNLSDAIAMRMGGFDTGVDVPGRVDVAKVVSSTHSTHAYFVRVGQGDAKAIGWANADQADLDAMATFLKAKGYSVRAPRAKTKDNAA